VLLDVNLSGTLSFPIVDTLLERGIPFVLCTAYADAIEVYPRIRGVPRVSKPVDPAALSEAILSVLNAWPKRRGR
jgi:CheY-like chemotaxis protein